MKTATVTFFGQGRAGLDVKRSVADLRKLQDFHDFTGFARELDVLLVGEHEQRHVFQRFFAQERLQLFRGFLKADFIGGVNHVHETVGVVVVVLPVGSDFALSSNIPDIQFKSVLSLMQLKNAANSLPET